MLGIVPAKAFEFGSGELEGSLNTTISHGATVRVEKRDFELAKDANGNDGNLNYDRGVVSNTSKFVTDLHLTQNHLGVFVRATGFIDFENESEDRERTPLSSAAKERVGKNVEVLDAYLTAGFDIGNMPVDVRLGKHVLNWGESTFIPNGINAINPFDVGKLRLPGSELREAMLPVGLVSVTFDPSDTLSLSGFYQYDWEKTRIEPVGSYFSTTDYVGAGADRVVIDTILERLHPNNPIPLTLDQGRGIGPLTPVVNGDLGRAGLGPLTPGFAQVPRANQDHLPEDDGQYGVALHYLAEDLNHTEFGFYFINYHSRLPTVTARTPSIQAIREGLAVAGAVSSPGSTTIGVVTQQAQQAAMAGQIPPESVPKRVQDQVSGLAGGLAAGRYATRSEYLHEYAEDIQLLGISFNTELGSSGWALQGEYSFRQDVPLQRAERRVVGEGLLPMLTALGLAAENSARLPDFLRSYRPGLVPGYIEHDVSQLQATATRLFGPALGASGLVLVAEAALLHVHNITEQPLESPAGGLYSDPPDFDIITNPNASGKADADATSWGYRMAARLDYYNAIGSIHLHPYAQFLHDVSGNSPSPIGPFVEGRMALTLGVRADYLSRWQGDIGYTRYTGDGNELSDRDFVSASVKYSF